MGGKRREERGKRKEEKGERSRGCQGGVGRQSGLEMARNQELEVRRQEARGCQGGVGRQSGLEMARNQVGGFLRAPEEAAETTPT
jgi:hypothetical protein